MLRRLFEDGARDFVWLRVGRVKYSTSCPSRMEEPSEASRAIPTSFA